eukprot:CAMPEP_0172751772 /NCGR_PEP_ID=MMETSP1074-20121228/152491_1 /TAXON_ID=2916 /ORGANISM="Ceratium fusus, Strain PA161109" /LENGTH=32 /DNA_ID= /DNA_START= /DNA_END= /DNA_ORIENTATION=
MAAACTLMTINSTGFVLSACGMLPPQPHSVDG